MFTGIITDMGRIRAIEQRGDMRARISTGYNTAKIEIGASIACDGVCLTVVGLGPDWFDVDISAETVSKTNLSTWAEAKRVNLERALKVGDELGGHIVSGAVALRAPEDLARFIAAKGSVALNGTSLTVNEVAGREFGINFIPHTKQVTTWGDVAVGDRVNLEIDTLARYVARLATAG